MRPAADFKRLLSVLIQHEVDFIVVGGVSAVLHGAPISTFDLDIVPRREPENISRLHGALKSINAIYRGQFGRRLEPDTNALSGPGHNLLLTDAGPLDVLGTIGEGLGYEELAESTDLLRAMEHHQIRVLRLATLIEIKEKLGSTKDLAVLPILRRALNESTAKK